MIDRTHQSGATLVVALLILVLIMMIGIAAVSTSDTQFKLAGNLQFDDSALNNAEAAVNEAENLFASGALRYDDPGFQTRVAGEPVASPHLYPIDMAVDVFQLKWVDTEEDATDADSQRVGNNVAQRYVIRMLSQNNRLNGSDQGTLFDRSSTGCNQVNTYEITGRGQSARGAVKYVQTIYSVLSCPA